jgi:hypothetical protein
MLPTSARFLFYELVARNAINKRKEPGHRSPVKTVIEALTDLREQGWIPWDWIRDETRSLSDYTGYSSVLDGVLSLLPGVGLDPWDGEAPLVLCESRSLAGVLDDLCSQYAVRVAPTNGQTGGFLHTDIIPILSAGDRVLYYGDLDIGGGQIEANTRRVLERGVGPLQWERLALTEEQVREYDLPTVEKSDRRYNDGAAAQPPGGAAPGATGPRP